MSYCCRFCANIRSQLLSGQFSDIEFGDSEVKVGAAFLKGPGGFALLCGHEEPLNAVAVSGVCAVAPRAPNQKCRLHGACGFTTETWPGGWCTPPTCQTWGRSRGKDRARLLGTCTINTYTGRRSPLTVTFQERGNHILFESLRKQGSLRCSIKCCLGKTGQLEASFPRAAFTCFPVRRDSTLVLLRNYFKDELSCKCGVLFTTP